MPYMKLAELLGSFAGQLTESGLRSVTIEYAGHAAELNTKPLSAAALKGLLAPMMDSVNMVNAPVMASERGIEVSEVRTDRDTNYQTLVRLTVVTDERTRSVSGTLFGQDRPRIVNVKGVPMEAELGAHMLYVNNEDKPGLIGPSRDGSRRCGAQHCDVPARPHRFRRRCHRPCRGRPGGIC